VGAFLYEAVTRYVTDEMDRAEKLAREEGGERRKTVVGFALTILQWRLASSPADPRIAKAPSQAPGAEVRRGQTAQAGRGH
jgi:hypothetical protein